MLILHSPFVQNFKLFKNALIYCGPRPLNNIFHQKIFWFTGNKYHLDKETMLKKEMKMDVRHKQDKTVRIGLKWDFRTRIQCNGFLSLVCFRLPLTAKSQTNPSSWLTPARQIWNVFWWNLKFKRLRNCDKVLSLLPPNP